MQLVSDILAKPEVEQAQPRYAPITPAPLGVDLADGLQFRDGQPFEYFHKLRAAAPVSWWPVPEHEGFWALTKYEDVRYCDQNPALFSSQKGGILLGYGSEKQRHPRLFPATLNSLINLDQPYHMPFRMAHRPFFSTEFTANLRKRVTGEVDRLLDKMARLAHKQDGRVDMVENFSAWLPLYTLCEMLGVEERDRPAIVRWMHYLEIAGYIIADPENKISKIFLMKFLWNLRQMFRYGERVMKERRKNPRDDLLSLLATMPLDNEPMSQPYLDGSWLLIVFAGNDTTRNSLSGTMRLLTEFPDQRQMLLDEPDLVTKLVPEALRLVSPVMYMRRTTTEETEIRGQKIAKGEKVVMWYGAANRDPDVFPDPDRMDLHRANASEQIAFGIGPHVCLGQRIAKMQLEIAYRRILDRFPHARWTGKQELAPNNFVHGVRSLEVELEPRGGNS